MRLLFVFAFIFAVSVSCSKSGSKVDDDVFEENDDTVSDVMNDIVETEDEELISDDGLASDETVDETPEEISDTDSADDYAVDYENEDDDRVDEIPEELSDDDIEDPEQMVIIPAGEFEMGCNEAVDTQCWSNECPYHTVTLSEYKIDIYEVTARQYRKCVNAGNCNNNNSSKPHYSTVNEDLACNLGADGNEDHPMNCVTRNGAKAYCEWAGKSLPTEAQWEKAARGTDGRKYPWGNEPEVNCDYVVMASKDSSTGAEDACSADGTMSVGSFEVGVSPYGVYDMIGNVDEWVSDNYGEKYYEVSPSEDPTGPETGDLGILKGGSWWFTGLDNALRSSVRKYYNPDYGNQVSGFRCVE